MILDLDEAEVTATKIEFDEHSGCARLTPALGQIEANPLLWVRVLLRWALQNHAETVQLMRDFDHGIVRQLIRYKGDKGQKEWFEALPVDMAWADSAFCQLIEKINIPNAPKERSIFLRCKGFMQFVFIAKHGENDLVIYLTPERPALLKRSEPFPTS